VRGSPKAARSYPHWTLSELDVGVVSSSVARAFHPISRSDTPVTPTDNVTSGLASFGQITFRLHATPSQALALAQPGGSVAQRKPLTAAVRAHWGGCHPSQQERTPSLSSMTRGRRSPRPTRTR